MHVPVYATMQGFLGRESERSHSRPRGDDAPEIARLEEARPEPAPIGVPPSGAPFRLHGAAPFLALLALGAACGRPAPVVPAPPPDTGKAGAVFIQVAAEECRASCPPYDATWALSEVAGALTMRCECRRLPNLGTSPKLSRNSAKAQKAASVKRSDGPEGPLASAEK